MYYTVVFLVRVKEKYVHYDLGRDIANLEKIRAL